MVEKLEPFGLSSLIHPALIRHGFQAFAGLQEDVATAAYKGDALHGRGFGEAGLDEHLMRLVGGGVAVGQLGDELAELLEGNGAESRVCINAGDHEESRETGDAAIAVP